MPFAEALSAHCAAVPLDDVTHNCKANAEPTMRPSHEIAALPELLENVRKEFRMDAYACIADPNACRGRPAFKAHVHSPAVPCELDRIRKQVPNDLLDAVAIAP